MAKDIKTKEVIKDIKTADKKKNLEYFDKKKDVSSKVKMIHNNKLPKLMLLIRLLIPKNKPLFRLV